MCIGEILLITISVIPHVYVPGVPDPSKYRALQTPWELSEADIVREHQNMKRWMAELENKVTALNGIVDTMRAQLRQLVPATPASPAARVAKEQRADGQTAWDFSPMADRRSSTAGSQDMTAAANVAEVTVPR
jgi:hypothetical protein